jgi:hypothetical protein
VGPLDFTHTLVQGRTCGVCYACCQVPEINDPALKKPANTLCPNYRDGCVIYETRPATCRSFHCLWRRLGGLEDELRPDRLGALFAFQREAKPDSPFAHVYVAGYACDGDPAAFETPAVQAVIEKLKDAALPVWLSLGARKRLVWPDRTLGDAIVQPATVTDPTLKARAEAWVKRYDRWVQMYDLAGG